MSFSFFKWSSLANTTNLNIFASTSTIRCRRVLYWGKPGFSLLGSGQIDIPPGLPWKISFPTTAWGIFPIQGWRTPDRRLQVWQDTTGIRPSQTRSGKLYSALYHSRFPGAGSHVRLSLVSNETPAHTVRRMYLSQVRQAWGPSEQSQPNQKWTPSSSKIIWCWRCLDGSGKVPGAEAVLATHMSKCFVFSARIETLFSHPRNWIPFKKRKLHSVHTSPTGPHHLSSAFLLLGCTSAGRNSTSVHLT